MFFSWDKFAFPSSDEAQDSYTNVIDEQKAVNLGSGVLRWIQDHDWYLPHQQWPNWNDPEETGKPKLSLYNKLLYSSWTVHPIENIETEGLFLIQWETQRLSIVCDFELILDQITALFACFILFWGILSSAWAYSWLSTQVLLLAV